LFRLPTSQERVTINGRTGSGKTVFAAWLLSEANFHEQPWTIIDFKGDDLLANIDRAQVIGSHEKVPTKAGLYYMHPSPHEGDQLESWLWRVWKQGRHGLFVDEGYMIPDPRRGKDGAFKSILAQGRSLHIPVYTLSQRPVAVNRSVFTEANFYASFHLNDKRDRDTVTAFTPDDPVWNLDEQAPPFHARWYDVGAHFSCLLKPVPKVEQILERFDMRLKPKKTWL
jgi:hypothetical protein